LLIDDFEGILQLAILRGIINNFLMIKKMVDIYSEIKNRKDTYNMTLCRRGEEG